MFLCFLKKSSWERFKPRARQDAITFLNIFVFLIVNWYKFDFEVFNYVIQIKMLS